MGGTPGVCISARGTAGGDPHPQTWDRHPQAGIMKVSSGQDSGAFEDVVLLTASLFLSINQGQSLGPGAASL